MFGVAAIVKDEAAVIGACLASLRPHIGWWTISDTGSTDGTQDIIREALAGIPGELLERPFVDFGHNRSEVFAAIRGRCDWYFATDADMVWTVEPGFVPDPAAEAYMVEAGSGMLSWRLPLVHRGDLPWVSYGKVHEYSALEGDRRFDGRPTDAVRIDMPMAEARRSRAKSERYAALLSSTLADKPNDPRATFFLAQTLMSLGERTRARAMYLRRVPLGDAPEEVYYSAFQAAMLNPEWPARSAELMAAWEVRPWRWEALHALCRELNARELYWPAYTLSGGEYPVSGDIVFVRPWVSAWGMTFEHSVAALGVGRYDECRSLSESLLARDDLPPDVRTAVGRTLAACTQRMS